MILTKYIKEGSFQTKGAFLVVLSLTRCLKSNLSQFEKTERVVGLRLVDHLSEEQLKKLHVKRKDPPEPKMKPHHELVDWNDIMGVNRDIYTRRGGAIRRR